MIPGLPFLALSGPVYSGFLQSRSLGLRRPRRVVVGLRLEAEAFSLALLGGWPAIDGSPDQQVLCWMMLLYIPSLFWAVSMFIDCRSRNLDGLKPTLPGPESCTQF